MSAGARKGLVSRGFAALPDDGEQARTKIEVGQLQPELQPEVPMVSMPQ